MYTLTINASSLPTLDWLAARGSDAGVDKSLELEKETSETLTYSLSEPMAWESLESLEDDPDAFLSCCGDSELSQALISLLMSIV